MNPSSHATPLSRVVLKSRTFSAFRKELPATSFLLSEYFSNSRDDSQIIISETDYSFASRVKAKGIIYRSDNSSNLHNGGDSSPSDETQQQNDDDKNSYTSRWPFLHLRYKSTCFVRERHGKSAKCLF